jgi:hypothetical protein
MGAGEGGLTHLSHRRIPPHQAYASLKGGDQMANLGENDTAATEPIDSELPDPNSHGQVYVHPNHPNRDVVLKQMKAHLAEHAKHLAATKAYHGGQIPYAPGDSGQSSQGGFSGSGGGGASGADYQTSSADSVGDADSGGPGPD